MTLHTMLLDWLDRTPAIKIFAFNLILSGSAAISDLLNVTATYLPMVLGAMLMLAAQILKMVRDQKSWNKDELRKDERHRKDMGV
jgi:hypothetical protein